MSDVSGVSGSGGAQHGQSIDQTNAADQAQVNQQQDNAYAFLQQELVPGLAAQKAILPDQG